MDDTIGENLKRAAGRFLKSGIDTAALDAEVLLAHTLKVDRIELHLQKDRVLTGDESTRFEDYVARRSKKEPVAYITGYKEFWSVDICVTPDVLIPRPETEGIVEQALKIFEDSKIDILDLCTGSGCVAAALATELPDAAITVTDISPVAIEVAKRNLAFAGDRITYFTGDLFAALLITDHCSLFTKKFDLITANPPYVSDGDFDALEDDIRLYEPQSALKAGADGLAISKRIIQDAPRFLKKGGSLIMEIGIGQADALWKFANQMEKYDLIKVFEDYSGIERILWTSF